MSAEITTVDVSKFVEILLVDISVHVTLVSNLGRIIEIVKVGGVF